MSSLLLDDPHTDFHRAQVFEAYVFYQADVPNETRSCEGVERCFKPMTQDELTKFVFDRAATKSADRQYYELNATLKAHVDILLKGREDLAPEMIWSCAACEFYKSTPPMRDYFSVIILGRALETRLCDRLHLGDHVELPLV